MGHKNRVSRFPIASSLWVFCMSTIWGGVPVPVFCHAFIIRIQRFGSCALLPKTTKAYPSAMSRPFQWDIEHCSIMILFARFLDTF